MSSRIDVPVALSPNIAELVWRGADTFDGAPVIVAKHMAASYTGLRARSAAFATELRRRGVAAGDRVAILLEHDIDSAAAFFGVVGIGGIAVPMSDALRPRQIEHVCRHASARVLIASADLLARQPRDVVPELPRIDPLDVAIADEADLVARVGSDVAQIIYTSVGSGAARGVTITHGNLWAAVHSMTSVLEIARTDRIASVLPFCVDFGLNQLLCTLSAGATLLMEDTRDPDVLVTSLRAQRATVWAAMPPAWMQVLASPSFATAIPSLRLIVNTGGRLPPEAVRRMRGAQPQARVVLLYGLTEAFRATFLPPDQADTAPASLGDPIPGTEVMVLRDDGTPCGPDEIGELVQRGPTVSIGYWNDPGSSAGTYRPNPMRPAGAPDTERVVFSGDLVRRDERGRLHFVGRRDKLIKVLGHRVSPDEVADALYASGEVLEAVVTAEDDGIGGEQIVAVVRLAPGGSVARLRAFCHAELPRYMQPTRYQVQDYLPSAPSGDYDVGAIRAHVASLVRR